MKNSRLKAMILLLLYIDSTMNIAAIANSVGVRRGDYIKYKFTYVGELPPNSPPKIDWYELEFLSVEGDTAYIRVTVKYVNSPEATNLVATVDLFSANWMHTGFVIPADSKIGDTVFVEGIFRAFDPPLQATIKGEETRTCLGVSRTVVYANYSLSDQPNMEPSSNKAYWDKQTGVLVEGTYHNQANESSWTTVVEVTTTDMWPQGLIQLLGLEWWQWMIIMIVVAASVATPLALILRRRKPPEGKP